MFYAFYLMVKPHDILDSESFGPHSLGKSWTTCNFIWSCYLFYIIIDQCVPQNYVQMLIMLK